jgi:hypothetical protein
MSKSAQNIAALESGWKVAEEWLERCPGAEDGSRTVACSAVEIRYERFGHNLGPSDERKFLRAGLTPTGGRAR